MIINRFESWWVRRDKCLFDDKRKGKSAMDWDVLVIKLTTDTGIEGIATVLAARKSAPLSIYRCLSGTVARLCQRPFPCHGTGIY